MKKEFGKVAVLMGGTSAEREVSLRSGQAVLDALVRQGVNAVKIDPQHDIMRQIEQAAIDRVFIALHGRGGEDGSMQGFLEILGLPYTGSGIAASAVSMNKHLTKQIWQAAGLPTPAAVLLKENSDWRAVAAKTGLPVMVKPAREGSSVGASKVMRTEELQAAWAKAVEFDDEVLAEAFIQGGEYTASILQDQALPLIRLETPRTFYDYEAKYHANTTRYICPCGLPATQEAELQDLALRAFHILGASGWGRVDFMLDAENRPWLLEVNTIPGMTDHSLVPMAAKQAGMDFDTLVLKILETSFNSFLPLRKMEIIGC